MSPSPANSASATEWPPRGPAPPSVTSISAGMQPRRPAAACLILSSSRAAPCHTAEHGRARMERAVAVRQQGGRAVQYPHLVERDAEPIGGDLGDDRLEPLPDRGRADGDRHRAVALQFETRQLLRPGATAFDETGDGHPVIAAVDQPAVQFALLGPAELGEAAVEDMGVIAAVAFGL